MAVKIYYKGNPQTSMQVMESDLAYWLSPSQGWTTSPSSAVPSAPSAPTQAASGQSQPGVQSQTSPSAPPPGAGVSPDTSKNLYLVNFSADPTPEDPATSNALPWLYDAKNRTFRPFADSVALDRFATANEGNSTALLQNIVNLSPNDLVNWPGTFLSTSYSPSSVDGSMPPYQPGGEGTPGPAIVKRYGKARNEQAEILAAQGLGLLFTRLNQDGYLSDDLIQRLSDPTGTVLAKYVSASLYGGYSMPEIYQDLKIQDLAKSDPKYAGLHVVDEETSAAQFRETPGFLTATKDPQLMAPAITLQDGSDLMKYPVYKISEKFYQENVKTIDWNDPQFKAEAEKILAGWYDVATALADADTEQAKKIADDDYRMFAEAVNKKYGIPLSNNAREAWDQLQQIFGGFSAKNLADSGFYQEAMDRSLADRRRNDQILRESKTTETDLKQREFLLNYATPDQIQQTTAKMDSEDAAAGKSSDQYRSNLWGLKPSQSTLDFYSINNLRTKFPDLSNEEIQTLHDTMLDQNGNLRSDIYRKAITNKYGISREKKGYQFAELTRQNEEKQRVAESQFNPSLSSYIPPGSESLYEPVSSKETGTQESPTAPAVPRPSSRSLPTGWTMDEQNRPVQPKISVPEPAGSQPPTGAVPLTGPSQLSGLTEKQIWRKPGSKDIYRLAG